MRTSGTLCDQVSSHPIQKATELVREVGHQCILIYRFNGNRTTTHVRECSAIFTPSLGTEALCADAVGNGSIGAGWWDKPGSFFQTHKLEDSQRAIRQFEQVSNAQLVRGSPELVEQCVGARRLHFSNHLIVFLPNCNEPGRMRCPAKLRGNMLAEFVDLETDHLGSS